MKLINFFNYKDWLAYVHYSVIIIVLLDFFNYKDTLVRWKWGYWSIDLIPATIILLTYTMFYTYIITYRNSKRIRKLEDSA